MAQKNRHKNVAVFAVLLVSSFSISLSFSPCFSLFPVVSCYLGTPKQPTKWGYRHIYIYAGCCKIPWTCWTFVIFRKHRMRLSWNLWRFWLNLSSLYVGCAKNPRNLKDSMFGIKSLGFSRISSTLCEIFLGIWSIFRDSVKFICWIL